MITVDIYSYNYCYHVRLFFSLTALFGGKDDTRESEFEGFIE